MEGRCRWKLELLVGEPKPVCFKPLWSDGTLNERKRNQDKEAAPITTIKGKQNFIQNRIAKYIKFWRSDMARDEKHSLEVLLGDFVFLRPSDKYYLLV